MGPRIIVASIAVAGLSACRCAPEPQREPALPPAVLPHYQEWPALVRAASRGDREAAAVIAGDLTEGEAGTFDGPGGPAAIARVSGALAFVGFAEDDAELADAVATTAQGCGDCHAAAGARPTGPRPPWTHADAAGAAVWGLVWNEPFEGELPAGDVPPEVRAAWAGEGAADDTTGDSADADADGTRAAVARVLTACAGCHGPTGTPGSR